MVALRPGLVHKGNLNRSFLGGSGVGRAFLPVFRGIEESETARTLRQAQDRLAVLHNARRWAATVGQ